MRLSEFIRAETEQIISEWTAFARTGAPAGRTMDLEALRDHIREMLLAFTADLDTAQTSREQADKSKGKIDADVHSMSAANSHGTDRAASGYSPAQMVAEFRALRASVLRLWTKARSEFSQQDVEDVTRFNEAIDQALAESMSKFAQDVERSKDLFLGVLGHDLRNPLGAMMMAATAMIAREGPDWPHLKKASRIVASGTRMNGIITDLLDFTRSRLGDGIPVVLADMDMVAACQQIVDELTAFHPDYTVHFAASGELRGKWDSARIAQALSNLVGNAYQHGLAGTPVEVAVCGEPEQVLLTVHNKGPVIAPTQLQEIFNPFRQGDNDRSKTKPSGSVGLGLYIAQAIAVAHGGKIDVESSDHGTTFTMRLPRNPPTAP